MRSRCLPSARPRAWPSATTVTGKVTVGAQSIPYNGGTQRIDIEPYGKTVTIALQGTGRVYYTLVVEGIRTDGKVEMEDRNLQVRREVLTRGGSPANLSAIRQNDLLVVKLTLTSSVDRSGLCSSERSAAGRV